jgi:hypothetical protein
MGPLTPRSPYRRGSDHLCGIATMRPVVSPSRKSGAKDRSRIYQDFCDRVLRQRRKHHQACDEHLCAFHFAPDICNRPSPMFAGPPPMMQNLPFSRRQDTGPLPPVPIQHRVAMRSQFFSPWRRIIKIDVEEPARQILPQILFLPCRTDLERQTSA